ncbi:2-amino-4-hydroxy-6-hydroxymethyldihydropteridine diphosphokinase [Neolewinella sp.]|uniref:2-amino-4-hydroxy-6- hydroxymethyldihydropteridine diphosphokinase n=1 Tax=Neolewinella sp. TaxID=2993543 RepID=UPI003B51F694
MAKLTLSLGSNLGARSNALAAAREAIDLRLGTITYRSAIIETKAWGNTHQPEFLNQLITCSLGAFGETAIEPTYLHRVLDTTQSIEAQLGRVRDQPWGPRTIDIDLIFLDDIRYEDHRLSLPHPWWRQRAFVTDLLPPGFDPYLRILDPAQLG